MGPTDIVDKTEKGALEIKNRALKLPQRLRTILILIDGTQSVVQLEQMAAKLGAPPDCLELLYGHGLVAPRQVVAAPAVVMAPPVQVSEVARFVAAQKFMNDTAVDALGLRAFFFTLKLEKCFNRGDLHALLDEYVRIITKASGPDSARILGARVSALLA